MRTILVAIISLLPMFGICANENDTITIFNTYTNRHVQFMNDEYAIILPNTGYEQKSKGDATIFENTTDSCTIEITKSKRQKIETEIGKESQMSITYSINGWESTLFYTKSEENHKSKMTLIVKTEENNNIILTAKYPNSIEGLIGKRVKRALLSIVKPVSKNNTNEDKRKNNNKNR